MLALNSVELNLSLTGKKKKKKMKESDVYEQLNSQAIAIAGDRKNIKFWSLYKVSKLENAF